MTDVKFVLGMSWYRREDYPRVREIMEDRQDLHDTFDDWQTAAGRGERVLKSKGHTVVRAIITPDVFLTWCRQRRLRPNANGRSEFASFVAAQQLTPQRSEALAEVTAAENTKH